MADIFTNVGNFTLNAGVGTWNIFGLLFRTIYWMFVGPFTGKMAGRRYIFDQMVFVGVHSVFIVLFTTLFTGIVLAMQSAYQLQKMGAEMYVASLVGVSLTRELGPVLVSLVVAGRVGSAIAAELGTMKVTEQIEALETIALDPVRFLVVPRFLALLVMLPCLTLLGDVIGMFGGWIVGVTNLDISSGLYIDTTIRFLELKDVFTGLFKSFIFAIIICLIGCYQGLNTRGGAEGVGRSTTVSVVSSFILIILFDCIITAIFYFTNV